MGGRDRPRLVLRGRSFAGTWTAERSLDRGSDPGSLTRKMPFRGLLRQNPSEDLGNQWSQAAF